MAGNINTAEYPTHSPEVKFRGMWSPNIRVPNWQPFLPTAPPQKPKVVNACPAAVPVVTKKKVLTGPPPEAQKEGCMNIWDRMKHWRGYIDAEGTCYNNVLDIIGYINQDSGEAGSADSEYLGRLRPDWVIENNLEQVVGYLDSGRAYVKDYQETTVAEVKATGEVAGHMVSHIGQFHGFNYHRLNTIALYLLLIDPGMLSEIEG